MTPPTFWLDTNVFVEIWSHGDAYQVADDAAKVEERRRRMQGSLWAAMALCAIGARTYSYRNESIREILRLAPPKTTVGAWTSAALYVLADGGPRCQDSCRPELIGFLAGLRAENGDRRDGV